MPRDTHNSCPPDHLSTLTRVAVVVLVAALVAVEAAAVARHVPGATLGRITAVTAIAAALLGLCWGVAGRVAARRARRERDAWAHLAELVSRQADAGDVACAAADVAAALTGAERALVLRLHADGHADLVGASATARALVGAPLRAEDSPLVAAACREGAAVPSLDAAFISGSAVHPAFGPAPAAAVAVPFAGDGSTGGMLVCLGRHRRVTALGHLDDLDRLVTCVADAWAGARDRTARDARASTDALTGTESAPALRRRLDSELQRAVRHHRDLSLAVVEVDDFALVRATHGDAVADMVLVEVARVMTVSARAGDTVARLEDHVFAWVMPDCDSLSAWAAVERLRVVLARAPLVDDVGITVSVGVADLDHAQGTGAHLRDVADAARAWARDEGGDMSVRYSPDVVGDPGDRDSADAREASGSLEAVRLLAQAVDGRMPGARRHSAKVAEISAALAAAMGWSPRDVARLREAALVLDVGKIGIPDNVLLKPGPLDPHERARVETHAALGAEMVADVLGAEQVSWVRSHHERWDGRGYPDNLGGIMIPSGARLLAVADAYDAMVCERPHRGPLAVDAAWRAVREASGAQFCPDVVEAFDRLVDMGTVEEIYRDAADGGSATSTDPAPADLG